MTPQEFIARWSDNALTEKAGAQAHFDDLCDLLGVAKPRDPDNYCFERGAKKADGRCKVMALAASSRLESLRTSWASGDECSDFPH